MGGKSGPGLADALGAYILAEPYLFAYVGMEREQNIYCVPWYLDPQQYTVAAALCRDLTGGDPTIRMGDIPELSAACKYSALNLLPLFRFHTIEFRHAPCYESAELTFKWFSIVEMLVEKAPWIASRPDPVEAVKSLLSQILSTEQLTRGYALAEEHDVLYRYNVFRKNCVPCTYKPENWGLPAALEAVERGEVVRARKTRLATRRTGNVGGVRLDVPRAPPAARAQRLRTPADIQVAEAPPTLTFATTDEAIYTTANTFADITAAMTARRR
jgi:hypothetical protein